MIIEGSVCSLWKRQCPMYVHILVLQCQDEQADLQVLQIFGHHGKYRSNRIAECLKAFQSWRASGADLCSGLRWCNMKNIPFPLVSFAWRRTLHAIWICVADGELCNELFSPYLVEARIEHSIENNSTRKKLLYMNIIQSSIKIICYDAKQSTVKK